MDHFDLVNLAITYIENRLMQPIATAEVAAATGYSRAHFGRLFLTMTGETPAGYIRKRRLSEAARKLVTTRHTIFDLALDYQFQSQEAFTRSFKRLFRLSPGAYRSRGRFTGAFLRITLSRQKVYRLHGETGEALPLACSIAMGNRIVPVRLHAVVLKHSDPVLRLHPFNLIHLWYA